MINKFLESLGVRAEFVVFGLLIATYGCVSPTNCAEFLKCSVKNKEKV